MAKKTATITADGTVYVASVNRRVDANYFMATIIAAGTFGSGTISWKLSPDHGVTLWPLKDLTGTVLTSNADDMFNVELGNPSRNTDTLKIYAVMAGSTSPSVTVTIYDNN